MEIALLVTAFALGLAASMVRLPPLVGYLVAGFVLHSLGYESSAIIDTIADLGVLLLLFGIGLKLRPMTLARPAVWGTAGGFAVGSTIVAATALLVAGSLGVPLVRDLDAQSAIIVGFALSFASTVFAVQALEAANESSSLAGRLSVGVLIFQDILAVGFLVFAAGEVPSPWALLVFPVFFLLRPALKWVLDHSGHGEIMVLLGFTLAIGLGAEGFEFVGLKPDLGALVAGLLLSGHPRAGEMADRLLSFKDLFLVGFFLSIGLTGIPSAGAWIIGLAAVLLVPLRSATLLWLFTRFRLRARTALHASLTLATYSEFGLIVGAAAATEGLLEQEWVATIGVAVAVSFVLASATTTVRYQIYDRLFRALSRLERHPLDSDDAIIDIGRPRVLIFGMGRIGTGAYDELDKRGRRPVVGVDRSPQTVENETGRGRTVVRGDALDRDFWERARFHPDVELAVAALNNHVANLECVSRIQEFLPACRIASIATYPDQVAELREAGVDVARNLYEEAGQALADDAVSVVWDPDA
jgi:predicted Kef-type K+ transport protein